MRNLKVASFFSGCGGFDLGFIRTGWEAVFAVDNDPSACRTYEENIGPILHQDVTRIDISSVPEADCWIGGPPCQSWSRAGTRAGGADPRGALFPAFARLIAQRKPRAFVVENVKYIIAFPEFCDATQVLHEAGYLVRWKALNSRNFGVPQHRERVFIIGMLRGGDSLRYPVGDPASSGCVADILEESVSAKYILSDEQCAAIRSRHIWKDVNLDGTAEAPIAMCGAKLPNNRYLRIAELNPQRINGMRTSMTQRVYSAKGLGPALCASMGNGQYVDGRGLVRRLTPCECARLQGFPDSFRIVCSDRDAYRQLGNAVTVSVAAAIASSVAHAFELADDTPVEDQLAPSGEVPDQQTEKDLRAA